MKRAANATSVDGEKLARDAGLRYTSDSDPGIRRRKRGKSFTYLDPAGKVLSDPQEMERIRRLAIPPAWAGVWICPSGRGHLQATGRDARGRKQYRYHPRWVAERDAAKYDRLLAFGRLVPAIRKRVAADLAQPGLAREKVLAAVVRLLQATFIRVGNAEYAKQNRSFGLTTLRDRHVDIAGSRLRFRFSGKSGKDHDVDITDARLARIVKRCQDIPGQHLFQYLDDAGESHSIDSGDVNGYLRQITGGEFSAKDFRTWAGTVLFAQSVRGWGNMLPAKRWLENHVRQAIRQTAQQLGNTPAICRRCYVHPAVIRSFIDGSLIEIFNSIELRNGRMPVFGLRAEEKVVLEVLKRH